VSDPQTFITARTNRCAHCDDNIKPGTVAYHEGSLGPFCSITCAGEWDINTILDEEALDDDEQ
jgi:hypothetical protein